MKLNEMIENVQIANKVNQVAGNDLVTLYFNHSGYWWNLEIVNSFDVFVAYIRNEFIEKLADMIISYDGYEFGESALFSFVDCMGDEIRAEITFDIM